MRMRNQSSWPTDSRRPPRWGLTAALLACQLAPATSQELEFGRSQWESWSFPRGAIEFRSGGGVALSWFCRDTDPLADAASFEHRTSAGEVIQGGVRVGSNPLAAGRLADQDEGTWWQPDSTDGLADWEIEIDLGRVVLLKQIRLVFPDTIGARPFRSFSVLTSEGATVTGTEGLHQFRTVAITIEPNRRTSLVYPLHTVDESDQATGENLVTSDTLGYRAVQYIRFVPRTQTPDAALAEIELVAVGENVGLGTFARGGSMRTAKALDLKEGGLFDGTIDRSWRAPTAGVSDDWRQNGQWFEWDLGATFWLSEIVFYTWNRVDLGLSSSYSGMPLSGYSLWVSDGRRTAVSGGQEDRIKGDFDYERLSVVDNSSSYPRRWILHHRFGGRPVRLLFLNEEGFGGYSGGLELLEAFLYADGYPAAAVLESGIIDLGRPRSFTGLSWQADLPRGTGVELRTKSGDTVTPRTLYYDKNGKEVTKERWESLHTVFKGATEDVVHEGPDWSAWSTPYATPEESFHSPTPRRYVRIRLVLSTDDPTQTPVFGSLALRYQEPLVRRGVTAQILPREAQVGRWGEFSYRIWPAHSPGDRGFDGLLVPVPSEAREVSVMIGGREASDVAVESTVVSRAVCGVDSRIV